MLPEKLKGSRKRTEKQNRKTKVYFDEERSFLLMTLETISKEERSRLGGRQTANSNCFVICFRSKTIRRKSLATTRAS